MLELEHRFRALDVHAHLDPDEEAIEAHGRETSPETLQREMHQAGVVRAVVSPAARDETDGYLQANNAVARLSVDRPFLAFARLSGPRDPGDNPTARIRNLAASSKDHHTAPGEIEQYAYDDRFHGFALDPATDGLPDEAVLSALENVGSPVLVQGGREFPPSVARDTLFRYDFPVVLAGFGGFPLDRELMARALGLLERYDELYLDTSFVRYRNILEQGLLEHPDRIVFGSGAPAVHPSVGVMELLTLDVSEDLMRRVFSKNPARVVSALAPGADV